MATVTVDDPEKMETKKIDASGKVYVSQKLAGKYAKLIIEAIEEPPEDANET